MKSDVRAFSLSLSIFAVTKQANGRVCVRARTQVWWIRRSIAPIQLKYIFETGAINYATPLIFNSIKIYVN